MTGYLWVWPDETHAIAKLEFQQLEHKTKAERLRSRICHAFQMVLNCPVELQINLVKFNNSKLPTSSKDSKDNKLLMGMAIEGNLTTAVKVVKERGASSSSRRGIRIEHATEWQASKEEASKDGGRVTSLMKQQHKRRQLQKLDANQKLRKRSNSQNGMKPTTTTTTTTLGGVVAALTSSRAERRNS